MSSSNFVEFVNIWCMLCLYPHQGALNPPSKGPIVLPSLYKFWLRLWFIEWANQPDTTWATANSKIDNMAYRVKQAVRKLIVANPMKQNYLTQSGSYKCLTFSWSLRYLLVSFESSLFPTCLNDINIRYASSECRDLKYSVMSFLYCCMFLMNSGPPGCFL